MKKIALSVFGAFCLIAAASTAAYADIALPSKTPESASVSGSPLPLAVYAAGVAVLVVVAALIIMYVKKNRKTK